MKNTSKNLMVMLILLVFFQSIKATTPLVSLRHQNLGKKITNSHSYINSNSQTATNANNQSRWYNYGETMNDFFQGTSMITFNYLFPDSNITAEFGTEYDQPFVHMLGDVLDVKSQFFNDSITYPQGDYLHLGASDTYKLDSIKFLFVYTRNINVTDSLIFEIGINNTNTQLPTEHFIGQIANYGYDTTYFKLLKYTQSNHKLNWSSVGGASKWRFAIALTNATIEDTLETGFSVVSFPTSALPPILPGKLVASTVSFKPGYSYNLNDTINSKNFVTFCSHEEQDSNFPIYTPNDYNQSYIINRGVRYNIDPNWNGLFLPAIAFTSSYSFEHHLIYYKISSFCSDSINANSSIYCQGIPNITGLVYTDLNNNCNYDNTDLPANNIAVKLFDNQNNLLEMVNTVNGVYNFSPFIAGTYQIKIEDNLYPFSLSCGQSNTQTVVLDSANQTISNINFPVVCDSLNDVKIHSVATLGWVFPGQTHILNTNVSNNFNWYNLQCDTNTYSGTVTIQVNGPVSFVAATAGALTPTVSGNTFTYSISDFNTLNPTSFGLSLLTDTTAQANDQICVHVEISPNPIDADTTNNVYDFCYNVVNSYDPNMKEVYPVNVLPGYDDWFTYTIHFQNTGNAPAFNIRLRDTLDTQLDLNTFEVLGYSHPANVGISGNILTVRFNNIMLPDSTSDYEGSMGYFQYRIKPTPNLPNGSQISNTAYIYFDFNAPIITNTTENNFDITVSATNLKLNPESFEIYPNPSTGVFTFKDAKNIQRVEVYNVMGQEIAVFAGDNTNKVSKQINLSNYSKGIYFAKINGSVVIKLVKE
ncbi:MAG: T9SS type A sorting domain-containing protein [Bacteroidota bacterium]